MEGSTLADYPEYKSTEELVEAVLAKHKQEFPGQPYKITIKPFAEKTGAASTQLHCEMKATTGPTKGHKKLVFLKKVVYDNPYFEEMQLVEREVLMYLHVIPQLVDFVKEQGEMSLAGTLANMFPKFLGYGRVASIYFLVLEDFTTREDNFTVIHLRDSSHTNATVHVALRRLAQYHGALYALTSQMPEFSKQFPILQKNEMWVESFHMFAELASPGTLKWVGFLHSTYCNNNALAEFLKTKISLTDNQVRDLGQLIETLTPHLSIDGATETLKKTNSRASASVLCNIPIHGDAHQLNTACSPNDVIFFDLQMCWFFDGLFDLHTYLPTSTTPKQRADNLPDFLETYYTTLSETCTQLGMSGSPYTGMNHFMECYKKFLPWQVLFGLYALSFIGYSDAQREVLIELEKGMGSADRGDVVMDTELLDKLDSSTWRVSQHLMDFFMDMREQGLCEELENL